MKPHWSGVPSLISQAEWKNFLCYPFYSVVYVVCDWLWENIFAIENTTELCLLKINRVVVQLSNIVIHTIVYVGKKKFNWSKHLASEKWESQLLPVKVCLFVTSINVILKIIVLTSVSGSLIVWNALARVVRYQCIRDFRLRRVKRHYIC